MWSLLSYPRTKIKVMSMHAPFFILFVLVGCLATFSTASEKCRWENSAAFSSCLAKKIRQLRLNMTQEINDFKIPRLEPLSISQIDLNYGASRRFVLKTALLDLNLSGLSKFNLTNLEVNTTALRLNIDFVVPEVAVTGRYKTSGHLLYLPVSDNGPFTYNISRLNVKISSAFHNQSSSQDRHFRMTDIAIDFELGKFDLDIGKYFRGVHVLRDAVNSYLNNNVDDIRAKFKRDIKQQLDQLTLSSINRILQTITLRKLFIL